MISSVGVWHAEWISVKAFGARNEHECRGGTDRAADSPGMWQKCRLRPAEVGVRKRVNESCCETA